MSEPTVAVTLKLPRWLYLVLLRQAEKHHTQVAPLIVDGLIRAFRREGPKKRGPRGPYTRVTTAHVQQIRELHGEALDDAAIAARLGLTKSSVSRYRRDVLRLPPIPRAGTP